MAMHGPKWLLLAALVYVSPDTPGVYELWDDDELIFVGSTHGTTLREELAHELSGLHRRATHFSWEISFAPAQRERQLLAEFEAEHHRPPKLNG
ncbi:MAG TPA: hypothetical protein VFI86_07180 [Burkholderiales bacterium]|nr:hypothetical protein [Burkholderiales bacterium]